LGRYEKIDTEIDTENMIDISNVAVLAVPLTTTIVRNGIVLKADKLCWVTKFTFNSMFAFYSVIFSFMILVEFSNKTFSIGNVQIEGLSLCLIFLLVSVVLVLFNFATINHISKRFVRQFVSLIIWSFTVLLLAILLFHEIIFTIS